MQIKRAGIKPKLKSLFVLDKLFLLFMDGNYPDTAQVIGADPHRLTVTSILDQFIPNAFNLPF